MLRQGGIRRWADACHGGAAPGAPPRGGWANHGASRVADAAGRAMNFGGNGWFDRYLEFRHEQPLGNHLPSAGVRVMDHSGVHHEMDQAIYYFLQPTGLLYGFPIGWPFVKMQYPRSQYFDSSAQAHLIFM